MKGTAVKSMSKTFLVSPKNEKIPLADSPPSLTKIVLELPSLCLTGSRDEEWKALPSFPLWDREQGQNIPDDWIIFESPYPTDELGVRMTTKGETPKWYMG